MNADEAAVANSGGVGGGDGGDASAPSPPIDDMKEPMGQAGGAATASDSGANAAADTGNNSADGGGKVCELFGLCCDMHVMGGLLLISCRIFCLLILILTHTLNELLMLPREEIRRRWEGWYYGDGVHLPSAGLRR